MPSIRSRDSQFAGLPGWAGSRAGCSSTWVFDWRSGPAQRDRSLHREGHEPEPPEPVRMTAPKRPVGQAGGGLIRDGGSSERARPLVRPLSPTRRERAQHDAVRWSRTRAPCSHRSPAVGGAAGRHWPRWRDHGQPGGGAAWGEPGEYVVASADPRQIRLRRRDRQGQGAQQTVASEQRIAELRNGPGRPGQRRRGRCARAHLGRARLQPRGPGPARAEKLRRVSYSAHRRSSLRWMLFDPPAVRRSWKESC
jgi:hypothetical protein